MKLEDKFFNSFFYPFLVGVLLSMVTVTTFLSIFASNYLDKRTGKNIVDLEKKFAKININSVNSLLSTTLLKVQASINEQLLFYLKLANKVGNINNYEINQYLVNAIKAETITKEQMEYSAFWFIDNDITEFDNLNNSDPIKLQLIVYSNILQNVYSTLAATKSSVMSYFFIFDKTDLFIGFPMSYYYENGFIEKFQNYTTNPIWCCDEKGKIITTYKFKCRDYYVSCKKAKEGIYDYNKDVLEKRTIYVTSSYKQFENANSNNVFNICVRFDDPISKGEGYVCSDIFQEDLIFSFDNFNSKLVGYYLISSVGFNNVFYYPQSNSDSKTATEDIFRWDRKFFLEEKTYFKNHIQKLITSNYYSYLNSSEDSNFEEIKINGVNTSDQYFYFNGEKFYFSIYPVVLEGITGLKEHVLSIVYFYNNRLYYERLESYSSNSNSFVKIILEIILFTVFGSGLLYLVVLSFNTLAKYIVIPIKNVNYMLKGIHIGGENRLEYLEFLKKRQDENLEKLEKIGEKKIKNELVDENDNHMFNNENNDDLNKNTKNLIPKEDTPLMENNEFLEQDNKNFNDMEYNGELINPNVDYNKIYDTESDYIEKEINFYE